MNFSYKFNNILGSVYHDGRLVFTGDGNSVLSPVGNKIIKYDLKNALSESLPLETNYNIGQTALSPNGAILLVATEGTELMMVSMISGTVIHRKHFKKLNGDSITALEFSPDGRFYVVCGGNCALVYITPGFDGGDGLGRELSPFKIHRVIKANYDEVVAASWSMDSQFVALGSKDLTVKVFSIHPELEHMRNQVISLSGHKDTIVSVHFASKSHTDLDLYSIAKNGELFFWEANMDSDSAVNTERLEENDFLFYQKKSTHYLRSHIKCDDRHLTLTCSAYNPKMRILASGFSNGAFSLVEIPSGNLINSLEVTHSSSISSISINPDGDWICLGSGVVSLDNKTIGNENRVSCLSHLIVWEWQSESFILKQSGTGAGVANLTECVAYSPDAGYIATGGTDGTVSLWNTASGFCFVKFGAEEHKGPITALKFATGKGGKVIISASLDGTIRAWDLNRYRNYRTLSATQDLKPAQFISLAVDEVGGEFVAAGAQNFYEIFLWSIQTGRLLECLSGHEGPVSGVAFTPLNNTLISCSWDKTARLWDLFDSSKCVRHVIQLAHDGLGLSVRPDGRQFAVSLLNGSIDVFDSSTGDQLGAPIEGKTHLGVDQGKNEEIREKNKYFTTLCYSSDGQFLLTGGKSKFICIYYVAEKLLVKRLKITQNLSFNGMFEYITKRKKAEFSFNVELVASRDENSDGFAPIGLAGATKGDLSARQVSPTIGTFGIQFSPTMRAFAAATTEGVLVFSLDTNLAFDPYALAIDITPENIRNALSTQNYSEALMKALRLNVHSLTQEVIESVPVDTIAIIAKSLPLTYAEKCLSFLATSFPTTRHAEFYLIWIETILREHAMQLKAKVGNAAEIRHRSILPTLRQLQRNLSRSQEGMMKNFNFALHLSHFLLRLSQTHTQRERRQQADAVHVENDEAVQIEAS